MLELICKKTCGTCKKTVAMLDERGVEYRYREYTEAPLSRAEIVDVLKKLDVGPKAVLRTHDKAFKELALTGEESDEKLLDLMAAHPTLLQRPIAVLGDKAAVGRPPENVLEIL